MAGSGRSRDGIARSAAKIKGLPLLALALVLTSCSQQGGEIKIGEYGSLTGATATFGQSTHNGILMAIDAVNAAGGVGGSQIRVITEDDQGKPEEAATVVSKLISQDQVVTILGEVASSNSLAGAPICQNAGVPMITPASTNPKVTQTGDFIFRVCFIDPFQGTVMAKFSHQSLGLKKIGILRDARSDYSIGLADFFTEEFLRLGGEVVGNESYQQGDVDFKAPLTALMSRQPEGLFIPGYYTDVGLIARQARELGFRGALLGGDGWDSPKLAEIGGSGVEGGYFSNHYSVDDPNPVVQKFIADYKTRFGESPDAMAALSYDAARVLVQSLASMNNEKPEAFKALLSGQSLDEKSRKARGEAMATLRDTIARTRDFAGVTGSITLDRDRNAQKPAVVLSVKGGSYQFVEKIAP